MKVNISTMSTFKHFRDSETEIFVVVYFEFLLCGNK